MAFNKKIFGAIAGAGAGFTWIVRKRRARRRRASERLRTLMTGSALFVAGTAARFKAVRNFYKRVGKGPIGNSVGCLPQAFQRR